MIPDLNEPSLHLLGKSDISKFKTTCTESFIYYTEYWILFYFIFSEYWILTLTLILWDRYYFHFEDEKTGANVK